MIYCLDTCIISFLVKEKYPILTAKIKQEERNICTTIISRAESISWLEHYRRQELDSANLNSAKKIDIMNLTLRIYDTIPVLQIDDNTIKCFSRIKYDLPKWVTIELHDLWIAAISITNECVLVTDNEKHFSKISELKYENRCK